MSRFTPDLDHPAYLVASIVALANHATALAVDSAIEAARAEEAGDARGIAQQVGRLTVSAGVATGEIALL